MKATTLNVNFQMAAYLTTQQSVKEAVSTDLFSKLINKEETIAVVGLGYVGLPLALHMSAKYKVVGFDVNTKKINSLQNGTDPCDEVSDEEFNNKDIEFHADGSALNDAKFFIVAVPTPVDNTRTPNLRALKSATRTVANHLSKGAIVVFESTVYPGCTEEVCVPILEEVSGLKYNEDFFIGYSPERINPGDTKHTFTTIKKIVSGSTPEALDQIAKVYDAVVTAGIYKAPSMKVAEAAKVVENTQRDINIGFMNELSYIFEKMDISIHEVLEAAGTKWNFLNFFPGMVGGHCIGVDPYYLIHKAKELGAPTRIIENTRAVNENMSFFLAKKLSKSLAKLDKSNANTNILIKGITFKEDVKDVRNSKVMDLVNHLTDMGYNVHLEDPHAENEDVFEEYGYELASKNEMNQRFDAVVFAVNHAVYHDMTPTQLANHLTIEGVVLDIRGTFTELAKAHTYLTI